MRKLLGPVLVATVVMGVSTPIFADNDEWSDEKSATVDRNRNSDAGIGNGGERNHFGPWEPTLWGEDGPLDIDPGASGDHNQSCPSGGSHPSDTGC